MKKFLLFVFLAALMYAIFLCSIVIRIREFRKLPQRSIAEKYFTGKYPHDIFARALIFKRGVPSYECIIRSWAYKPNQISNTFWNRWILENDVSRMTLKERVEHLPEYPLDPEGILPYLKDILYGFSDGYKVLSVLAKFQASTSIYQDWIEKRIVLRQDGKLFLKCIKYIVQLPDVDMGKLFEMFRTDLIVATEKDLSGDELGGFEYYQLKGCGSDLYSFYIIRQFLKLGTKTSASLLDWMDKSLSNNRLELTAFVARVIGLYTYSTNPQEVQIAQTILMRELGELDPCEASFLDCSTIPAKKLFSITQSSSPLVAISFFHNLAHGSIIEAEAVAKPILSGPDSELRKGLIVLLIRHGSSVGKLYLDDAFRGNAKRSILFQRIEEYVYGSEVVERYCRIARHAYTGIPKTWPLYGFDGSTWQEEVGEWRKFIDEIPWFPGTDDAYYRMGYLQYAFGDWEDAVKTIREFASRELPDNDARQYVAHLLMNLSFKEESLHERFPELEHVYHIQRLGILVFEQHPDMQNNTNSINWLLSNVNYQRLLA